MNLRICLLTLLLSFPVFGLAYDVEKGYTRMDGDEIQGFTGNTLFGDDDDGAYVIYFLKDQKIRVLHGEKRYTGYWGVGEKINKEYQYCHEYIRGGDKFNAKCYDLYRKGDEIIWYNNVKQTDTSTLHKGNPKGL